MKFLQRIKALFQRYTPSDRDSEDVVKDKYSAYSVEHYPLSGKFYPKKNGRYLKESYMTGIIEYLYDFSEESTKLLSGKNFQTERDAWTFIDKAIEQMDKVNVRVLTRKET